jgi:predicted nucleotidyltransferase
MTPLEIKDLAVATIKNECAAEAIVIKHLVLFGSQSRQTANLDSDWDFLVIVDKELSFAEKALFSAKIQTILAQKMISIDLVFKTEQQLEKERNNTGCIITPAIKYA